MEMHDFSQWLTSLSNLLSAWQRDTSRALSLYLRHAESLYTNALAAAAFAFALGMLHAVTPGHGKIVVFSYFFGRDARPWSGIVTSLKIAATHIGTAIILFLAADVAQTVFFGRAAGPALVLQAISYLAIAVIGAFLTYQGWSDHYRSVAQAFPQTRHGTGALPVVVGMLPCPLTLLILSYAVANATIAAGLVLISIMGLGIATTISLVALLGIFARQTTLLALSGRKVDQAIRTLEIVGAVAIFSVGVTLFLKTIS